MLNYSQIFFCLGDDFFLFVVDDGNGKFIFDVVRSSNVTLIYILRWIKELNCKRYGLFWETSGIRY